LQHPAEVSDSERPACEALDRARLRAHCHANAELKGEDALARPGRRAASGTRAMRETPATLIALTR
jgi:hypothetical protein